MGLSINNIKKWTKMFCGKSELHVNQGVGKVYSKTNIAGYYNDLTEKITRFGKDGADIPLTLTDDGKTIYFSIAVFQYGLAAFDLFLQEQDEAMLKKAESCADWAVKNQLENGAWSTFEHKYPDAKFSAMAQGEGISLLLRLYNQTGKQMYADSAKKAFEFMLSDEDLCKYDNGGALLYEYMRQPIVLNGWIFAFFGLYDYSKSEFSEENIVNLCNYTAKLIADKLETFDNGYWSKYNCEKSLASPFYHSLHVALLRAMYDITEIDTFDTYAKKWDKYQKSYFNKIRALFIKALQKIKE